MDDQTFTPHRPVFPHGPGSPAAPPPPVARGGGAARSRLRSRRLFERSVDSRRRRVRLGHPNDRRFDSEPGDANVDPGAKGRPTRLLAVHANARGPELPRPRLAGPDPHSRCSRQQPRPGQRSVQARRGRVQVQAAPADAGSAGPGGAVRAAGGPVHARPRDQGLPRPRLRWENRNPPQQQPGQ